MSRDLRLALREGGATGTALGFFLVVVAILPLGLGPDLKLLARLAPGLLWIALLLSALLSLDRLFHNDAEDGSLETLAMGPLPLEAVAAAKALAHWLTTCLPLVVAAPLMAVLLNLPIEAFGPLVLTMAIGSPALSFLGAIGASLTLGLRRGGPLLALLVLPLYVPVLIFGVTALTTAMRGGDMLSPPFLILLALSLAAGALAPIASAAALRANFT
jgi:heme exporter protein B